jgi:signal peptidase II
MSESPKRNYHLMVWPALAVVLLDQLSKLAILHTLRVYESVPVLKGLLNLVHIRNRGMAFGIMNRQDVNLLFYFLLAATIGAVILLVFWFFRLKQAAIRTILGLSLILGGALGNLIDRLRFGEVIDFVDFYVGPYHWPAFNVADSAITVGTFLVAIGLIFQRRADS